MTAEGVVADVPATEKLRVPEGTLATGKHAFRSAELQIQAAPRVSHQAVAAPRSCTDRVAHP